MLLSPAISTSHKQKLFQKQMKKKVKVNKNPSLLLQLGVSLVRCKQGCVLILCEQSASPDIAVFDSLHAGFVLLSLALMDRFNEIIDNTLSCLVQVPFITFSKGSRFVFVQWWGIGGI